MITVLSPAKKLSAECHAHGTTFTQPQFLTQSNKLVKKLQTFDPPALQSLMSISEKLSMLNWERYKVWKTSFKPESARQAVYTFMGDTYNGLDVETLNDDDILFSQDNTRILSGLYGILKPLDLMMPYRLEMGTKLENEVGKNLYEFWGSKLSKSLSKELNGHKTKTIINCASVEYFNSIDNHDLKAEIVTPVFKEIKNGKPRIISFFAKKARGMMARFIIQNRIENIDDILAFDFGGYRYNDSLSSPFQPVFTRAQA